MREQQNIAPLAQLKALLKEARKRQACAERREIKSILRRERKAWKKVKSPGGKIARVSPDRMQSERGKELNTELRQAFVFADRGFNVFLPKEEYGVRWKKSFDAIVNGVKFEFKQIAGKTEGAGTRYRRGLEQSENISVYIPSNAAASRNEYIEKFKEIAQATSKKAGILVVYFQEGDALEVFDFSKIKKASNKGRF